VGCPALFFERTKLPGGVAIFVPGNSHEEANENGEEGCHDVIDEKGGHDFGADGGYNQDRGDRFKKGEP
jgi:hypothetical protein